MARTDWNSTRMQITFSICGGQRCCSPRRRLVRKGEDWGKRDVKVWMTSQLVYCLTICVNIHRQLVHLLVTAGREVLGLMVIARRSLAGPTTLLVRKKILSWWIFTRLLLRIRNWWFSFQACKEFCVYRRLFQRDTGKRLSLMENTLWRARAGMKWSKINIGLLRFS